MKVDLNKIAAALITVRVPVKVYCETGYCGSDSTDTLLIELSDVLDFSNSEFDNGTMDCINDMAQGNAESHGEDVEDCGECDGCENGTGCDDPQDSQSVNGSGTLFRKDMGDEIDCGESGTPYWSDELDCWLWVSVPHLDTRIKNAESRATHSNNVTRTLQRQINSIRKIVN